MRFLYSYTEAMTGKCHHSTQPSMYCDNALHNHDGVRTYCTGGPARACTPEHGGWREAVGLPICRASRRPSRAWPRLRVLHAPAPKRSLHAGSLLSLRAAAPTLHRFRPAPRAHTVTHSVIEEQKSWPRDSNAAIGKPASRRSRNRRSRTRPIRR